MVLLVQENINWENTGMRDLVGHHLVVSAFKGKLKIRRTAEAAAPISTSACGIGPSGAARITWPEICPRPSFVARGSSFWFADPDAVCEKTLPLEGITDLHSSNPYAKKSSYSGRGNEVLISKEPVGVIEEYHNYFKSCSI